MIQKKLCWYLHVKKFVKGWTIMVFMEKILKLSQLCFYLYFFWFIYLLKAKWPLTSILHVLVCEWSILVCVAYDDLIYKCNLMLKCNGSKTISYIKRTQLNIKWERAPIAWIWTILSICTLQSQSQNSFNMVVQFFLHMPIFG